MTQLGHGEAVTALGRTRFAVHALLPPYQLQRVIAFVREPPAPEGGPALVTALVALTTLLVGVAATVAYAVARDANEDVVLLTAARSRHGARAHRADGRAGAGAHDGRGRRPRRGHSTRSSGASPRPSGATATTSRARRRRTAIAPRSSPPSATSCAARSTPSSASPTSSSTEVDGPLTPDAREEVEQIRGSGAHLLDLINDILEFSAIESGQLKLTRTQVDLAQLADEVVREAPVLLGEQARSPVASMQGEAGVLADADARRVRQILTNLVGNAIKFTQQGQVVVIVGEQGPYARSR